MKKLLFAIGFLLLTGCQSASTPATDTKPDDIGLANPASVNCTQKGGTLEMRTNEAGQYGVCKFNDGTECDEWEFLGGQCVPGLVKSKTATINNFDDCVKAGNPVMESYPRKCSAGGQTFTEILDKPVTTPPSDGQTARCRMEKNTVCALIQVQCIKAPCPPLFETIDNECLAKDRGSMLLGYTPGVCEKTLDTTCKTDSDCILPGEYAAMNRCPMAAKCIADSCVVVCPVPETK